jgi:hypothetical protein
VERGTGLQSVFVLVVLVMAVVLLKEIAVRMGMVRPGPTRSLAYANCDVFCLPDLFCDRERANVRSGAGSTRGAAA